MKSRCSLLTRRSLFSSSSSSVKLRVKLRVTLWFLILKFILLYLIPFWWFTTANRPCWRSSTVLADVLQPPLRMIVNRPCWRSPTLTCLTRPRSYQTTRLLCVLCAFAPWRELFFFLRVVLRAPPWFFPLLPLCAPCEVFFLRSCGSWLIPIVKSCRMCYLFLYENIKYCHF